MSIIRTPLRYPGGKSCLASYFKSLFKLNGLEDGHYAEAYCGGAGVAIELLLQEVVRTIHINDADNAVAAFWRCVAQNHMKLCERVEDTNLSIREWDRQKSILKSRFDKRHSDLSLGFAMFYLNRTNRSGILNGGIIGGRKQSGKWKIGARFNKNELIQRISRIASYSDRINIYQQDALRFIKYVEPKIRQKGLLYLDPPYYRKGHYLYLNYYKPDDHIHVANRVKKLPIPWVVSYDNTKEISCLYTDYKKLKYSINYSALKRARASEIMFFSNGLNLPRYKSPVSISRYSSI